MSHLLPPLFGMHATGIMQFVWLGANTAHLPFLETNEQNSTATIRHDG